VLALLGFAVSAIYLFLPSPFYMALGLVPGSFAYFVSRATLSFRHELEAAHQPLLRLAGVRPQLVFAGSLAGSLLRWLDYRPGALMAAHRGVSARVWDSALASALYGGAFLGVFPTSSMEYGLVIAIGSLVLTCLLLIVRESQRQDLPTGDEDFRTAVAVPVPEEDPQNKAQELQIPAGFRR
jgi:hypothetical protein